MSRQADEFESLVRVARITRTDATLIVELVERRLVPAPVDGWSDEAIEDVERVRRLTDLGVNLEGVEVILHMRQELIRLHRDVVDLERQIARLRAEHDEALARLIHAFSQDAP